MEFKFLVARESLAREFMYYIMHHGIMISKIAVNVLNNGVGAQLGLKSLFLLGTGLTGLGHRSDRLIYVQLSQCHADRSNWFIAPV